MSTAKDEIRLRVNDFVTVLNNLVRQAAVEEVAEAIKNAAIPAFARRPAALARLVHERKVADRKPGSRVSASIADSKGGQQRTPELLAQLMGRVHGNILHNPGQGVGQIAASLGTSSKDLSLLLRKLLDDKKVISKGKKRGTRYFPR
jgi:DNA-binding NtrC family response regulator